MQRVRMWPVVCLGIVCVAVLSFAKPKDSKPGPITGTWQCMSHGGSNGDMEFTLDLQQDAENVSGSVNSPMGGTEISSGTYKNHTLEIHIDTDNGNYLLTGKLKNGQLSGEWSLDSGGDSGKAEKGTWEGKKGPAPSPSQ